MIIFNPENIREFSPNSKIAKEIDRICDKYKVKPSVQVYKSSDEQNYRGLTLGNTITLYWSDIETAKSIVWIFCHELRHFIMYKKPKVFEELENIELTVAEKIKKKKIHKMSVKSVYHILYDIGITEAICNLFATEEVGKDYGVSWYNTRLINKSRRENNVRSTKG